MLNAIMVFSLLLVIAVLGAAEAYEAKKINSTISFEPPYDYR